MSDLLILAAALLLDSFHAVYREKLRPMPLALMVVPWSRSGSHQGSFTTTWVGV